MIMSKNSVLPSSDSGPVVPMQGGRIISRIVPKAIAIDPVISFLEM